MPKRRQRLWNSQEWEETPTKRSGRYQKARKYNLSIQGTGHQQHKKHLKSFSKMNDEMSRSPVTGAPKHNNSLMQYQNSRMPFLNSGRPKNLRASWNFGKALQTYEGKQPKIQRFHQYSNSLSHRNNGEPLASKSHNSSTIGGRQARKRIAIKDRISSRNSRSGPRR